MSTDNYPNPNDCKECDKDADILYFHRAQDRWLCLKCYEATGESTSCFSCGDKHE